LGKQIHELKAEEAISYSHFNSFNKIQEHLKEKGYVFVFLARSTHKIKKKAEQAACQEAISLIS
jgi:predicted HicB family RNase H-like nuclease